MIAGKFKLLFAVVLCWGFCGGAVELPDRIFSFDYTHNFKAKNPALPGEARRMPAVKVLQERCAGVLNISEEAMVKILPVKGGMMFARCPEVKCGNRGEKFKWDIAKPDVLHCLICKRDLTVKDYPEDNSVEAITPEGRKTVYRYHKRSDGHHCWITGGMDYLKYRYFSEQAWMLGALYIKTKDKSYARKAAVIIAQLANAYLNTPYKIEPWLRSPYKEMHFYNGIPDDKENVDAQRARPPSWAYMDIPDKLILAYDFIADSGELARYAGEINMDVEKDILRGYFMSTVESTSLKRELYGNMSPYYWNGMLIAGRVLGIPEYVHLAVLRTKEFVRRFFFYDGAWCEVTSGYHQQCVNALGVFERIANGYSDPASFRCKYDNSNYRNFKLFAGDPVYQRAKALVSDHLVYPDNTAVAHNDTNYNLKWRWGRKSQITPSNFISSWRHLALKGEVKPDQIQLRIAGGPVLTHRHQDLFNITLWAYGTELLGDIGYTHAKFRQYASSLPHHNTVTVDYRRHNWSSGSPLIPEKTNRMATGVLPTYADISSTNYQTGQFRAFDLYKNIKEQQRTVALVKINAHNSYAVDFFELSQGGKTYDYFLHGDCDQDNLAPLEKGFKPAKIVPAKLLLPEPKREIDRNAGKPGYGYQGLYDVKKLDKAPDVFTGHFSYGTPQAALTVHLASFGGKRSVWSGKSPSIRRAKENSAKAKNFMRRFYMQRVENPTGKVHFNAVLEPHEPGKSLIRKVTIPTPGMVKIELANRTDYVFCNLNKEVKLNNLAFKGSMGYLSLDNSGKVLDYYLRNGSIKGAGKDLTSPADAVLEITDVTGLDSFKVADLKLLPGKFNPAVVLDLPGEKSAWQFVIKSVDRTNNIVVLDRPHGLQKKAGQWIRTHYQQRTFAGKALLKIGLPIRK